MPDPEPTPVTVPSGGGEFALWVESVPIDGLLLGEADCESYDCDGDLPGADCTPEGYEVVLEYREVVDPLAWFDDGDGDWELMRDCCWTSDTIETDCCADPLPATIRVTIEGECDVAGTWDLTYNSGAWINLTATDGPFTGADDMYIQCFEGELQLVFFVGGVTYTFAVTITTCDPFVATVTDIDIPVVGYECTTATLATGGVGGCEVWGLFRWLNIPAGYTVGDEECTYAPEECCLGDPIRLSDIDGECEWSYDCEINRRLYLHLYDGEWACPIGGTPSGTSSDQTIILDYNPGAPGVDPYWGGQFNCDLLDPDSSDCSLIECVEPGYITLTPLCDTTATDVCPLLTLDACDEPVQWWKITVTAGASPSCGAQDYAYIFCTPCDSDPLLMMPAQFAAWSTPPGAGSFCYLATKIRAICGTRFSNYSVMISE